MFHIVTAWCSGVGQLTLPFDTILVPAELKSLRDRSGGILVQLE
ncbi:MAG: hypothetical protein U9Q77_05235 [Candidatus Marinimicrobia bacterium]|nr:hypothetical protein [Candidatus Neomarinimicrobiota bacterium]